MKYMVIFWAAADAQTMDRAILATRNHTFDRDDQVEQVSLSCEVASVLQQTDCPDNSNEHINRSHVIR